MVDVVLKMANLLGILVAIFTFPGLITHYLSRKFFYDRAERLPVVDSVQSGGTVADGGSMASGNIKPTIELSKYNDLYLVCFAPLAINSVLAIITFFIEEHIGYVQHVHLILLWLGISFGMHAFPNNYDATQIWNRSLKIWRENQIALIGFPVVILIKIANVLKYFWFDLIYAILLLALTIGLIQVIG